MAAPTAELPQAIEKGSRGRKASALICFVLAALLTTPAALAFWAQRTLTDPQRYIATVGPLAQSPEVQDAVSTATIKALQERVDVEAILTETFQGLIADRPRLQLLVGPIASGVNSLVEREVRQFVASEAFQDLWVVANTRAQQAFIRVLEGDNSGAVSLQGDQIVLDLSEVIEQVRQRLVARGLTILQNVPIPSVDKQIVLMDAPKLAQARTIYAIAQPVATWALAFVAVLYLVAFLLAPRRPLMTAAIGISFAVNALLVALALAIGERLFVLSLSTSAFGPASTVLYAGLLAFLMRGWRVFFWFGLVLAAAGWFAGRTSSAVSVRRGISSGLRSAGSRLGSGMGSLVPVGRWVQGNASLLRVVVVVLGAVVLLWGLDTSLSALAWSVVLVVVLLAAVELLAGAARPKSPLVVAEQVS